MSKKQSIQSLRNNGCKVLDMNQFSDHIMKTLLGDILTIIDASISGEQQNKAIKDLIKGKFWKIDMIVWEVSYNWDGEKLTYSMVEPGGKETIYSIDKEGKYQEIK